MHDVFRMSLLYQSFPNLRMNDCTTDALIVEWQALHFLQCINIAAIEDNRALQRLVNSLEVRVAELAPLRDDRQRVGAFGSVVEARGVVERIAVDGTYV